MVESSMMGSWSDVAPAPELVSLTARAPVRCRMAAGTGLAAGWPGGWRTLLVPLPAGCDVLRRRGGRERPRPPLAAVLSPPAVAAGGDSGRSWAVWRRGVGWSVVLPLGGKGEGSVRGRGVLRGVGRVGALAGGAGEGTSAVGAVGGPHRLDLAHGAGLGAQQAGLVQHQSALAGGDGADDPVHPLGAGPARRLVGVGGDHGGEGDRPVGGQGPVAG